MASPTTTIFVAAILRSRFSIRSRVIIWTWGVWRVTCGVAMKSRSRCDARIDTPHAARPTFFSRYPSLLLSSPAQLHAPYPAPLLRAVRNQVHAAVARQHPAAVGGAAGDREPQRARHRSGEQRRRRGVLRHGRIREPEIGLALAQQRDFGLEQYAGPRDHAAAQRQLIVAGEITSQPDPAPHDGLGGVGCAIGEIRDLRVERRPAVTRDPALRAEREAVGRRLFVAGAAAIDLDVVDHERAEQLRALDARRDVETDEIVRHRVLVVLLQQAEREDVGEPRLELAITAGDDRPFPQ